MRRAHLIFGLAALVVFLFTGAYMDAQSPPVRERDDATRMMFRSRHIYVLLAGLCNVPLGIYLRPAGAAWRRAMQRLGSAFILTATALLVGAFFYEPWHTGLPRTLTLPAIVLLLAGTLAHLSSAPLR